MNILVVGGAGYIGSHMVKRLLADGHQVIVVDNLSTGYQDAVLSKTFYQVDIASHFGINQVFKDHIIDAVFHFASYIQVGESVTAPAKYYENNVSATLTLLQAMVDAGVKKFVFSSTAAVFGNPEYSPIDENHPKRPINPYGHSKLMVEQILKDFDHAYALKSVCLRYFNAAGADPEGQLGERHEPETHLIPLVLQAASGRRSAISIFGNDYDTPDGTCVRDYIHINDLADAHVKAIEYLNSGNSSDVFNLGNGKGFSVKEIIHAAEKVTGKSIPINYEARRAGDPPILVADATKAQKILGWSPHYTEVGEIIQHAWGWEQKYPWGGE
jgi:UDP-glucose 4-epimerase